MPILLSDSPEVATIDEAMQVWRQGDIARDERWFVHAADPARALTDASAQAEAEGAQALTSEVDGLVVLTQTCDIIRSCLKRPYLEVAPVVPVSSQDMASVQRGYRPNLAPLPVLSDAAVDLDRVMTVEKSIAAQWKRTPGVTTDTDVRAFAQALARKRARFAFPDDFVLLVDQLQQRLAGKHDKNSDEGLGLRALREIRVQASPAWDSDQPSIFFWFLRDGSAPTFKGQNWNDLREAWLKLVPKQGRFVDVDGVVVTLDDMTGTDYVASDPLDLDHLSSRTRKE